MSRLNIGCGSNKIEGFINIDSEPECNPDLVHDIVDDPLPYADQSINEITLFHSIEHIPKRYHQVILLDFHRVLVPNGRLFISYPNFWECAQRWKRNEGGQRAFWEATIYGRQLYNSDYHVALMEPTDFSDTLTILGFKNIHHTPEPNEPFNTITYAEKGQVTVPYETEMREYTRKVTTL